jgi:alkanesulfonate monooxygenase SsuD/methylene tetrahydromethanopterin reductase-like flavin-dependent oxidoreductase (luciferase family)
MKFAHFSHVWGKPGMTAHARYEELWRELELCDALGFDYSFCVEHHFRPDESWMSAPSLYAVGGGARTKRLRVGAMGYVVPLHHPLRLAEEIAIVDQMLGGRFECGLVPGISPGYFTPFGIDYNFRKSPTFEFVHYMRAAYGDKQPFSFHGDNHKTDSALLAVQPMQKPHPPLWMMSRDPPTLEFCAQHGVNTGYFINAPRHEVGPRYRKFLADWQKASHPQKPNVAYSTVVYVDETDQAAIDNALFRASRAYEGLLPVAEPGETFEDRLQKQRRGSSRAARSAPPTSLPASSSPTSSWRTNWSSSARPKLSPTSFAKRPKSAFSTLSSASSISPTCRKPTCGARSACSARR